MSSERRHRINAESSGHELIWAHASVDWNAAAAQQWDVKQGFIWGGMSRVLSDGHGLMMGSNRDRSALYLQVLWDGPKMRRWVSDSVEWDAAWWELSQAGLFAPRRWHPTRATRPDMS